MWIVVYSGIVSSVSEMLTVGGPHVQRQKQRIPVIDSLTMPISRLAIFFCWLFEFDDEFFDSFAGDFDLFFVLVGSSWDAIDCWWASFSVKFVVDCELPFASVHVSSRADKNLLFDDNELLES